MKKELRFAKFYAFAGMVLFICAIVLTLGVHALRPMSDLGGLAEFAVFGLSWLLAMMFGLRAHRLWAYTLNQVFLSVASVGLLIGFFVAWHPLFLLGGMMAVACYTYFFRTKKSFPARAQTPAVEALKDYTPSSSEKRVRRLWLIGARILQVVYGIVAAYCVFSGIAQIALLGWGIVSGLLTVGFGVLVFCWRLLVVDCAHGNWGTRMSLWETITTGSALGILVSGAPLTVFAAYAVGWWVPALWVIGVTFNLYYFIASYRLRQVNLAFREYRESIALDAGPALA